MIQNGMTHSMKKLGRNIETIFENDSRIWNPRKLTLTILTGTVDCWCVLFAVHCDGCRINNFQIVFESCPGGLLYSRRTRYEYDHTLDNHTFNNYLFLGGFCSRGLSHEERNNYRMRTEMNGYESSERWPDGSHRKVFRVTDLLPDTCPHCGVEDPWDDMFSIEWRITEGPEREKSGSANVHLCTNCGEPVRFSRKINGKPISEQEG